MTPSLAIRQYLYEGPHAPEIIQREHFLWSFFLSVSSIPDPYPQTYLVLYPIRIRMRLICLLLRRRGGSEEPRAVSRSSSLRGSALDTQQDSSTSSTHIEDGEEPLPATTVAASRSFVNPGLSQVTGGILV